MRVLLVQPPLTPNGPVEPPVGLAALAAWLVKLGHTPKLLDLELFQRVNNIVEWDACVSEFNKALRRFEPDVVGVTSMYSNSLHAARLISLAKTWRTDVATLAGGSHFGALPRQSLIRHPALDFVIQGEGEGPLAAFLGRLETDRDWAAVPALAWRRGDEIVLNGPGNLIELAELPDPWTTLDGILDPTDYLPTSGAATSHRVAYLEAGRGCPFMCSFCATAPFWQRRYRVKPVKRIVEEIRTLHQAGYDRFVLVHDLLTVNRQFIAELCDEILDSRLPIEWMANARTDLSLDGLLPRMKAAGCWKLFFGIESASERVQASIDKHLDPEQAYWVIANLGRHGLTSTCSFVIGFPDETAAEISASIRAGARMKILGAEIVQFHRLRIWPPAKLSGLDLSQAFDLTSLKIEYPYLEVLSEDLDEIAESPDFFGGYFTPDTLAGGHSQVAQLEMFAHHAVALCPMSIYALETFRPKRLVSAFYGAIERVGALDRTQLDWDGGQLLGNWETLKPYLMDICESLDLTSTMHSTVLGILSYEEERIHFTTSKTNASSESVRHFLSTVDIPGAIRRIQNDESLEDGILKSTEIMLRRTRAGLFESLAKPARLS
jgi:radical SAM superfamily enzyme YgiQ (UPF0313 family)